MNKAKPATLPFIKGEMALDEFLPIVLALSKRDVKRCIQAVEQFIEANGEEMIAAGLDSELMRYEDILYRLMGVPEENMRHHVAGRADDRRASP